MNFNWSDDIQWCFVNGEKYFFVYPNPHYDEETKSYSGIATVWHENEPDMKTQVPFRIEYTDLNRSSQVISTWIERYLGENGRD